MPDCDVLISGAGPAGAAAALVLAGFGVDALVLDRSRFPRPKLCGGLLSEKTLRLVDGLYKAAPGELSAAGVVDSVHTDYAVSWRDRVMCLGAMPHPFYLVRRDAFDAWCLERARQAGARLRQGEAVSWCDPDAGVVRTAAGETISARVVIGADGATSAVRKSFPASSASRRAWRDGLATGLEIFIPPDLFPRPPERIMLHLGVVGFGYGWVFPRRETVAVGVCGLYKANRATGFKALLADYLALLGLPKAREVVRETVLHSHSLPYGNFLRAPARGRTLLAGDAAGMIEPFLGEGVYYAMRTGQLAARAALAHLSRGADPAAAYLDLIGPVLTEMQWSLRLRRLLFGLEPWLGGLGYRVFLGLFQGAMVDVVLGRRSFRFFRRRRPEEVYL